MPPLRRLGFVVNAQKQGAPALGAELMAIARAAGVEVKPPATYPVPDDYLVGQDACCVIGGDGTLLGAVRAAARAQVPLIGVNRGSLGFLTTFTADEVRTVFPTLLAGDFKVTERALLACRVDDERHDVALNDVLIKDEINSRIVRLEVFADDELVTDYYCDGLIFSTPTGSTAYNLSAGGPLIHPSAGVTAMTPICPHTLSNRAIIFREQVKLTICNRSRDTQLLISMDGQRTFKVSGDRPVEIRLAAQRLSLVQRHDYSHFAVVRTKLKWTGGYAERQDD